MSTPVNLNQVRKTRLRASAKKRADANAVAFGRSKAEKEAEKLRDLKAKRQLDGHKRET